MKIRKNSWDIHEIHITSWLIKDIFWTLKLSLFATIMVAPTVILALYILIKEKENRDGNWTLFFWLLMNISWMLHELQNFPYWSVKLLMILGVTNTIRLIIKRKII
jgi:hypothetical protein